jgi:dipeptide transport system substrate-binding protein
LRVFVIALAAFFCLSSTGQTATPIKTLVFCSRESPDSFNPQLSTSQTSFDASSRQIYDRLVTFRTGSAEIVPALAESWWISKDGRTYVFRLRAGVSFHTTRDFRPSRELTAEDVVFSFSRQLDRKHSWHGVSGGGYLYFRSLGLDELVESVTATDEMTVTFRLTRPSASFLAILAMDFASILSAEYAEAMLEAGTPERLDREPVGTGPFMLVQYQRDALIRYAAHREYWRGAARIDNLVFAITPDTSVRMQRLRNGECHAIDQPDPADLPALLTDPAVLVARQTAADLGYLAFNVQKPVLSDVRVRRALTLAIDRQAIVDEALGGIGTAASSPLPPGLRPQAADEARARHDPDRAREILAKAGYDNLSVNIWAMPVSRPYMRRARRVAEMIRAQWAAIGVEATVTIPDWETFLKHSMVGAHETILFGWIGEPLDPDIFLSPILGCVALTSGANRSRWCDPGFDRLLLEARRTTDRAEREAIYEIVLERFEEQLPLVPLVHSVSYTPLRREVTGYVASALGGHYFYGVDLQ